MTNQLEQFKRAIEKQKTKLKKRKFGYENFGDKETRKVEELIDSSKYDSEENEKRNLLKEFSDWCGTYNGIN